MTFPGFVIICSRKPCSNYEDTYINYRGYAGQAQVDRSARHVPTNGKLNVHSLAMRLGKALKPNPNLTWHVRVVRA